MLLREDEDCYGLYAYLLANESKCIGRQRKLYVAGRGDTTEVGDTPSSRDGRSTSNSGSGSLHWLDLVLSLVPPNVMVAQLYAS